MLSDRVQIDLHKVDPDRMRRRLAFLSSLPDGVRCEILVGALAVEANAARSRSDCPAFCDEGATARSPRDGKPWLGVPRAQVCSLRSWLGRPRR